MDPRADHQKTVYDDVHGKLFSAKICTDFTTYGLTLNGSQCLGGEGGVIRLMFLSIVTFSNLLTVEI